MAKRFTDTNKYKKPFIRGLQGAYKVLWDYLYHDCDHAGIWIVDFEIAQIYVGQDLPINKKDAFRFFNKSEIRIIEIDCGTKWFIPSFINFQYGELKESNRAHNSVINILKNKGLISSLQGAKDKDKDKVKDMDKDKDKENTHPALISFKNNVLREAKEMAIDEKTALEFFEYWSAIEINSKQFLYQVTNNFALTNKLKGWVRIKNNSETESKDYDYTKNVL